MRNGWFILLAALFLPACASDLPLSRASPTPEAWLIQLQVTIIQPSPTYTATPEPIPTATPTGTPVAPAATTPALDSLPAPGPTSETLESVPGVATPAAPSPPALPAGRVPGGAITLVELPREISLPADVSRVEFKWVWEGKGCARPPTGQGFEIRIWPDRPDAVPLGIMDASQADAVICDEKSGTWIHPVGNLRSSPWISQTLSGRFLWQVLLVALDTQRSIAASEVRAFYLPLPITTPAPTPTPTPPRVTQPAGTILLEQPQDGVSLPEKAGQFEFKWRWSLSSACQLPPEGYGFELRLWPDYPGFGPLGAMGDARESQDRISCDPANGVFGYLVTDLGKTRALQAAGAGRFRWDVVLVRLDPYEIVVLPGSRSLVIPGQSKLE